MASCRPGSSPVRSSRVVLPTKVPTQSTATLKAERAIGGIAKSASCHTLQRSFATHLVATGYDIRTVQHVLGHRDLRTTMIYTQVLNRGGLAAQSPPDTLSARALRVQADDPGVLPMAHTTEVAEHPGPGRFNENGGPPHLGGLGIDFVMIPGRLTLS